MAPTRAHSHPPRPLDVAQSSADRVWIHADKPQPSLVTRVASEFREMPGLVLTLDQAARLFDLGAEECWRILEQLQRDGVIECDSYRLYRLADH